MKQRNRLDAESLRRLSEMRPKASRRQSLHSQVRISTNPPRGAPSRSRAARLARHLVRKLVRHLLPALLLVQVARLVRDHLVRLARLRDAELLLHRVQTCRSSSARFQEPPSQNNNNPVGHLASQSPDLSGARFVRPQARSILRSRTITVRAVATCVRSG